jgi:hypothetical protein
VGQHDKEQDAAMKAKCKEMDERKAALLDALLARSHSFYQA